MSSWGNGPVQVRLTVGQTVIGQADIRSFCHRAACCDGDIGLGQVCAASITATLTGARDLLGETIIAELGGGSPLVWHNLGTFIVSECRQSEDSTAITAQDAAWWALSGAYTPTVSSGATVYDVLEDVADQCGLDVEQTTLNLGLGISVTGDLTGHTCRAMLGYLAALCGCNCVISRAGEIRFVWFESTEESIDPDRTYAGAHTFGGTSTLTGLRCTVSDGSGETALTAGDADTAVEFSCPYMTQTRLEALWNTLGGYQYPVLEVSCYGGAEVLPGDLVTVVDRAENSLSLPVMEVSLSVDGGCRCTLRSYGKGDTARASDSIGPRELRLQRVEQTAGVAMQSANGKNKVFHQASAPVASEGLTAGDLWFDTANGNRISTWTGSAWSAFELGSDAIANLSITNAKIADATIQSGKIASVDAGSITAGTLNAARIAAGSITADKLDVADLFSQNITVTGVLQVDCPYYEMTADASGLGMYTTDSGDSSFHGELYCRPTFVGMQVYAANDNNVDNFSAISLYRHGTQQINYTIQVRTSGEVLIDAGSLIRLKGKIAEGNGTIAEGGNSHAEGYNTYASGPNSHAEGGGTTAEGDKAHAEGNATHASGNHSHAEGHGSIASGPNSHAEGGTTTANNWDAHAEGSETVANGEYSHAEGLATEANGPRSHSGGYHTIANGSDQTAIGSFNIADTSSLFIIGNGSWNGRSNAMTVDKSGNINISGQFKRHGNDFIILRAYDFTASCAAGDRNNTGSGSVSVSGYTPLGIVGFEVYGSNCSFVSVYRCNLDGDTAHWHIRNNGTSNFSGNIYLQVLYMAN